MKAKISKKTLEAVIRAAVRGTVENAKANDNEVTVWELSNVVAPIAGVFGYNLEISFIERVPDGRLFDVRLFVFDLADAFIFTVCV